MKYKRTDYDNLLSIEFDTIQKDFERLVDTKASSLKERGDVFVSLFQKVQDDGMVIFKIPVVANMPRKNSFWNAVLLKDEMAKPSNWGDISWKTLCQENQIDFSDAHCVWLGKCEEDPKLCLIGINKLTIDFVKRIEKNAIIAFGPQIPPMQYILNLKDFVNIEKQSPILDYVKQPLSLWNPQLVHKDINLVELILNHPDNPNCVIQGPPGTGKTYRMAQLAARLLAENKSVLVTALTNRALIELAEKDDLKPFVKQEKISKTSLTIDELCEIPKLQRVKDNLCNAANGYLTLGTFYITSGWTKDATDIPFDYVIMDEASQALLPMIAATLKLGKNVIWIGDQKQLAPIVTTNEDIINRFRWDDMVNGFNTLCNNFSYPSYLLGDSFRLSARAANCTGVFYNGNLKSAKSEREQLTPIEMAELNPNGGPTLLSLDLKIGEKTSETINSSAFSLVYNILNKSPKAKVAVISKFKDTVKGLQKYFAINNLGDKSNIRIETVDRIQGLTVDYCVFVIPNASVRYSTELELFNVATSRALYNTIIIADKQLLSNDMSEDVRKYLLKAQEDKAILFNKPQKITSGNIGVTITGKIDLNKFKPVRKEIVKGKENIYVIDTNVFVECPDIISRIGKEFKITVPAKVLEELDKLKLRKDVDKKALNDAAKNINAAFTNSFSSMEDADVNLLPNGFDKRNPDCMILSVALKYKNENKNAILLTSDNLLQSRARGLDITTISLKDFLQECKMR